MAAQDGVAVAKTSPVLAVQLLQIKHVQGCVCKQRCVSSDNVPCVAGHSKRSSCLSTRRKMNLYISVLVSGHQVTDIKVCRIHSVVLVHASMFYSSLSLCLLSSCPPPRLHRLLVTYRSSIATQPDPTSATTATT